MYRKEPEEFIPLRKVNKEKHLPDGFRPVDQFPAQDFNLGLNGFPANDITLLARATNEKEYSMILTRLQEIKLDNPDNVNKTDRQLIDELVPNWVNTPYLLERFVDYMVDRGIAIDSSLQDVIEHNEPAPEPAPANVASE